MLRDDKTAPGISTTSVHEDRTPSVLGLVVVWSRDEPDRVGQVALIERPLYVGRRARGAPLEKLASFAWQIPGEPLPPPSMDGLLTGASISALQILLTPKAVALEVENKGECKMLVNGLACQKATLRPRDTVMLKGEVLLLCVRRPVVLPALRAARVTHARGEPNAVGAVGESPPAWQLEDDLAHAARSGYHVMLEGESGTGKRGAAELIHLLSPQADGPFVIRNITTLAGDQLVALELFGNAKGHPQAGDAARPGLFAVARGGIGFLDEIGDCPLKVQAALLTALDEDKGVYTVLGTHKDLPVEARIVAATNRDPSVFRKDFYWRFKAHVRLPPLRERPEDIVLILRYLLRKLAAREREAGCDDLATTRRLSGSFVDQLVRYPFPGNVRELEEIVAIALKESPRGHIRAPKSYDLGPAAAEARVSAAAPLSAAVPVSAAAPVSSSRASGRGAVPSKERVVEVLEATEGNVTEAAKILEMSRDALNRLIVKYGLRPRDGG